VRTKKNMWGSIGIKINDGIALLQSHHIIDGDVGAAYLGELLFDALEVHLGVRLLQLPEGRLHVRGSRQRTFGEGGGGRGFRVERFFGDGLICLPHLPTSQVVVIRLRVLTDWSSLPNIHKGKSDTQ